MYLFTFLLYLDFLNYLPILYLWMFRKPPSYSKPNRPLNQEDSVTFGTVYFLIGHFRYNIVHNRSSSVQYIVYYWSSSVQYTLLSVIFGTVLFIIGHVRYNINYYRSSSVHYTLLLFMFGTVNFNIGHLRYSILYYQSCSVQ